MSDKTTQGRLISISASFAVALSGQFVVGGGHTEMSPEARLAALRDAASQGKIELLDQNGDRVTHGNPVQTAGDPFDRGSDRTPFDKK